MEEPVARNGALKSVEEVRACYEAIAAADDPAAAFAASARSLPDEISRELFEQVWEGHPDSATVSELMQDAIASLLRLNLSEHEFYERLWCFVRGGDVLTDDDRVPALYFALIDPRMPYVCYDLVSMPEDKYDALLREMAGDAREMRGIAMRSFSQKTEEASAVLAVAERHGEREERVALLAVYLGYLFGLLRGEE